MARHAQNICKVTVGLRRLYWKRKCPINLVVMDKFKWGEIASELSEPYPTAVAAANEVSNSLTCIMISLSSREKGSGAQITYGYTHMGIRSMGAISKQDTSNS